MHSIKLARARQLADTGRYPSTFAAMLAHVPDDLVTRGTARLIAATIDAMHRACRETKAIADRDSLDNYGVWCPRRNRFVDLAS